MTAPGQLGPAQIRWCSAHIKGFAEAHANVEAARRHAERVKAAVRQAEAVAEEERREEIINNSQLGVGA